MLYKKIASASFVMVWAYIKELATLSASAEYDLWLKQILNRGRINLEDSVHMFLFRAHFIIRNNNNHRPLACCGERLRPLLR